MYSYTLTKNMPRPKILDEKVSKWNSIKELARKLNINPDTRKGKMEIYRRYLPYGYRDSKPDELREAEYKIKKDVYKKEKKDVKKIKKPKKYVKKAPYEPKIDKRQLAWNRYKKIVKDFGLQRELGYDNSADRINEEIEKIKKDLRRSKFKEIEKPLIKEVSRREQNRRLKQLEDFLERNRNTKQEARFDLYNIPLNKLMTLPLFNDRAYRVLIRVSGDLHETKMKEEYYTIESTRASILNDLAEDILGLKLLPLTGMGSSDSEWMFEMLYNKNIGNVELVLMPKGKGRTQQAGGYFKYTHIMDNINLEKYGLFTQQYLEETKEPYAMNCLERAFLGAGFEESKLDIIRQMVKDREVPKKNLKDIAENLNVAIHLNYVQDNGISRMKVYNKNATKTIRIGLIDRHYFLYEKTNYTRFSIVNYEQVKDEKEFWNIEGQRRNGKYRRTKKPKNKMNSMDLFKLLLKLHEEDQTHLKPIDCNDGILKTQYYDRKPEMKDLTIQDRDCKPVMSRKLLSCFGDESIEQDNGDVITKPIDFDVMYFDFESTIDGDCHRPYLVCGLTRDGKKSSFIGRNCAEKFLNSLTTNTLLIAHNLRYDLQFLIDKLCHHSNMIKTGRKIKSIEGTYYNPILKKKIKLKFKDSYALISKPLKKFSKMFKLETGKEIMPYNVFTSESIKKPFIKIEDAKRDLYEEEHYGFEKNLDNWDLRRGNGCFNHIEYSRKYCEIDCWVLKEGYETFREWMFIMSDRMNVPRIDIDLVVSIPQLANKVGVDSGCFDGVYKLGGVVRHFIQQCVEGGRCMTRNNKKWKTKARIQDFDAVSLYPSAMYRMDGFLMGKPKLITQDMIDNVENLMKEWSGYFVEIEITGLKTERHFPLLSIKNKKGIREYTNDVIGKKFFVDKYKLEDLVEFQGISYKVIRGYYFDEGRNNKINGLMEKLFNERVIKKKEKNPIQEVYKLIMNAFYGKLIMKPIEKDIKFVYGVPEFQKFYNYHYNKITKIVKLNDRIHMVHMKKPIINHFSMPHCGSEVLSYSKRIMNEVMCLAEDIGATIYYQDTDSMHILEDQIKPLESAYRQKYGRELIGKNMGQFHCDFDFESNTVPVAVESIFLGKKSYIDKVEITSGENNDISYEHHVRCRGIPSTMLFKKSDQLKKNIFELYEDLYDEKKYEVDIVECCKFKSNDNFTTTNNESFIRTLYFNLPKGVN